MTVIQVYAPASSAEEAEVERFYEYLPNLLELTPQKRCLFIIVEWVKEVAQLCPTLWDSMDCSLQGSSIHGTFQGSLLEWVAISFFRRSSQSRDWTQVSYIVGRCLTFWASREVIIVDWNAKIRSQEIPGVTGKFGLGVQNEAGQTLIEFCQENALVIAKFHFQKHKRRL